MVNQSSRNPKNPNRPYYGRSKLSNTRFKHNKKTISQQSLYSADRRARCCSGCQRLNQSDFTRSTTSNADCLNECNIPNPTNPNFAQANWSSNNTDRAALNDEWNPNRTNRLVDECGPSFAQVNRNNDTSCFDNYNEHDTRHNDVHASIIHHQQPHVVASHEPIIQQRPQKKIRNNNKFHKSQQPRVSSHEPIIQHWPKKKIRNNNLFHKSQQTDCFDGTCIIQQPQQQPTIRHNKFSKSLQTDQRHCKKKYNKSLQSNRQYCRKKFDKFSFAGDFNGASSHEAGGGTQKYEHGRHINHEDGNRNGPRNQPLDQFNNYTEEDLIRNSQIYEGSPTYAHGNWKWRLNEPLEKNDNYEEDLAANSHFYDRQEIEGGITKHYFTNLDDRTEYLRETEDVIEDEDPRETTNLDDLTEYLTETKDVIEDDHQTVTKDDVITQKTDTTLDEQTDTRSSSGSFRPVLRIFRESNPNNETYRLYYCVPLCEGDFLPIGYEDSRRIASVIYENINDYIDDYWIQEDNEADENSGLSEEAISQQLRTRIYIKSANERNRDEDEAEKGVICVICLQHYEDRETLGSLGCGHEYHVDCISKWLLVKNKCPICKYTAVSVEDAI